MTFKREDRYIVIKRSDLDYDANDAIHGLLAELCVPQRQCLVIESDWPEYEPAWAAIEARVTGKPAEQHQGEPVAYLITPPGCSPALVFARNIKNPSKYADPLYTHADPAEVERLRNCLRTEIEAGDSWKREAEELRAQLAERDALLREKDDVLMAVKEQFDRHGNSFPDRFDSRVFRWVNDAVASASAEPSAPAAKCTNEDSWNCKCCRNTESCEALKDPRNFGEPSAPVEIDERALIELALSEYGKATGNHVLPGGFDDKQDSFVQGFLCRAALERKS